VVVGAAVSPTASRALVAWAWVWPVTSGTVTWLPGGELVLCGDEMEGLGLGLGLGPPPPLVLANATAAVAAEEGAVRPAADCAG
jgi:hypothetical protein